MFPDSNQGEINHLTNLTEISKEYSPIGTSLISASSIGISTLDQESVRKFISERLNLNLNKLLFLKRIDITNALPKTINTPNFRPAPQIDKTNSNLYLASDTLSYGSQNAALFIGKEAASSALKSIE